MTLSIERRADRWSDRTAAIDVSEDRLYAPAETIDADRITYADLERLTRHAAGALADVGIDAGDTVCSLSRNRVSALALLFACRRLGATFAPVSHRLTPATVHRPLETLEPALVVYEPAQRDLVRELPPARSATFEELAAADRSEPNGSSPADPLLALHDESGERVVAYSAAAVEWNCLTAALTWGLGRDDRLPVFGPLSSFDALLRVALPTLYVGGTLLMDRAFDPDDALAAIERERATALVGRATELDDLAGRDGFEAALESVDRVVSGTAPGDETRDAYAALDAPIDRAYGRLECPTALAQSRGEGAETAGSVVGRPVLDCEARLVDGDGTTLSGAAEGRLELAGPVLADGYRSDGTSDADADANRPGRFADGWFATGERFRRDEDGVYWADD